MERRELVLSWATHMSTIVTVLSASGDTARRRFVGGGRYCGSQSARRCSRSTGGARCRRCPCPVCTFPCPDARGCRARRSFESRLILVDPSGRRSFEARMYNHGDAIALAYMRASKRATVLEARNV